MGTKDTIFALATPTGKSAIATIRISGKDSLKIIDKISNNHITISNKATLNNIINNKKEIIDKTLTTIFKKPKSYTGEDMVEISAHGSLSLIHI